MFIKPREGLRILDPNTKQVLPAEGKEVSYFDLYWTKLITDGDVTSVPKTKEAAPIKKGAE